jgi:hypothetical protein
MLKIRTRTKKLALLTVAAIALAACGGSNGNSNSDSTDAARTKNAALATLSCATGGSCVVGDVGPGGGKVFYVAPSSFTSTGSACGSTCTYLEAAPVGWITASTPAGQVNCSTLGTSSVNSEFPVTPGTSTVDPRCAWSGTNQPIGTTGTAIGTGYANTSAMIAQNNEAGKAGTAARAFQGGNKTDWYLPSKDELNQINKERAILGVVTNDYYWSSSENGVGVWDQLIRDRVSQYGFGKETAGFYVRPVRAFSAVATVMPTTTTVALTCATGGSCVVGDVGPGGGKVFYVAPTSFTSTGSACGLTCTYLEAAPAGWITTTTPAGQVNCVTPGTSTAEPVCVWSGNKGSSIGKTLTAIGTGYANTSAMIAQNNEAGKAGTAARAFQGGNKTDWYLPSKDELNQMYINRNIIDGLGANAYWSSSEIINTNAWTQYFTVKFNNGTQTNGTKADPKYVRPVRAF